MMKLTLTSIHPYRSPQAVPLACAFLKSALLADDELKGSLEIELANFYLEEPPASCAEAILHGNPAVVAFSVYVWNVDHVLAMAKALKERVPALIICAGGPEATASPSLLLDSGSFDFVIRGEGEAAMAQAMRLLRQGASLVGVPGVVVTGMAPTPLPAPVSVESSPSPYLSGLLDPAEAGGALWQLSRGCDFACAFCFDHKGEGGVRRVGMQRIEEELRLFARLNVPQVFVLDSTFNKVPKRAKEILRLIKRLAPKVHFHFEVRSEFIDPEMAELFASITCSIQIGLQSADPVVLRGVGRGFDRGDFFYRISLLNNSGAIFGFDLIYGLPGDTPATFRDSLDFALSLYPNHLDIFPLSVLPGTRLHGKSEQLGLKHLPSAPYTLISTPTFSPDDLEEASRLAAACDIFYSRGKAVAWFNAVTAALKLTPSEFLARFASFLREKEVRGEQELSEQDIWDLQRGFLTFVFRDRKKKKLLPAALDLADYHHYYARALMATPSTPPRPRELAKLDLLTHRLRLASSASLARFNYEILDILEAGEIDLAEFTSCFSPAESYAVIYPASGEICTESIARPYYDLLLALDGSRPAGVICRELSLPTEEAISFLEFAVSEAILTTR